LNKLKRVCDQIRVIDSYDQGDIKLER